MRAKLIVERVSRSAPGSDDAKVKYVLRLFDAAERLDQISGDTASDELIAAINRAYTEAEALLGIDWDDHPYLLKATESEQIAYAKEVVQLWPSWRC